MKKLISTIIISLALSSAVFALSDRYAELRTDVDMGFSNNYWAASDIFKENIEIDLQKIAEEMPKKGWMFDANLKAAQSLNFNFRKVEVKFKEEVEWNSNLNIGKGLFDFFGKGYEAGQTVDISAAGRADVFAVTSLEIGVNAKKFGIHITPSAFVPVAHLAMENTRASVTNTADSELKIDCVGNATMYTLYDLSKAEDFGPSSLAGCMGYDLKADVIIPVSKKISVTATARVPVIPGKLNFKTPVSAEASYNVSAMKYIDGDLKSPEFGYDIGETEEDALSINRPMKLGAKLTLQTKKKGVVFDVMGGAGFRYPFSDAMYVYPEYAADLKLCAWNALGVNLSTEYTDEIFSHSLGFRLNCRVLEIDFGVSLEGGSFINSFRGSGAGGYFTFCLGF